MYNIVESLALVQNCKVKLKSAAKTRVLIECTDIEEMMVMNAILVQKGFNANGYAK